MRYFPVHIVIKDFFFLITLFLTEKIIYDAYPVGWWGTKEILGASIYIGVSLFFLNLAIFTVIHFTVKAFKPIKSFVFGAGLHLFTILIAFINLEMSIISFLIASFISMIISGYVYKNLNSGFSFEKNLRKCAGVE